MAEHTFYSRGKLLITGEYLVMEGAKALALPLKYGQRMEVTHLPKGDKLLYWRTYVKDKLWFEAVFDSQTFQIIQTNDNGKAMLIQQILHQAKKMNKSVNLAHPMEVNNYIDFSMEWGFGSSSSLISNIAYWFKIDPYHLSWDISTGSGYDIACARANGPLVYSLTDMKPHTEQVIFNPPFTKNLFFVYLGRKQHTVSSIAKYRIKIEQNKHRVADISDITTQIISVQTIEEFERLINMHEEIISSVLGELSVKQQFFSDYPGAIKSLGAWGGDFVLVTSVSNVNELKRYFIKKGLTQIFRFNEIAL